MNFKFIYLKKQVIQNLNIFIIPLIVKISFYNFNIIFVQKNTIISMIIYNDIYKVYSTYFFQLYYFKISY